MPAAQGLWYHPLVSARYPWLCTVLTLVLGALLFPACPAHAALRPDQLVLVVNGASPEGKRIARFYMEKRGVPRENMVTVQTSTAEDVGRDEYEGEIAGDIVKCCGRSVPIGLSHS